MKHYLTSLRSSTTFVAAAIGLFALASALIAVTRLYAQSSTNPYGMYGSSSVSAPVDPQSAAMAADAGTSSQEATTSNTWMRTSTVHVPITSSAGATLYPYSLMTVSPAPAVVRIEADGSILIRGYAVTNTTNSLALEAWVGIWTINVLPDATINSMSGDLSTVTAGHFVGIVGTVSMSGPNTIDATVVRDWTTSPITSSADTTGTGSTTEM